MNNKNSQPLIIVPSFYRNFKCIADKCRHTCCTGWEIEVDSESLPRFLKEKSIAPFIDTTGAPQIKLDKDERCPFLNDNGLCNMITEFGKDFICNICRDHPRFRNYWTNMVEIGLGLVCEEAARLVLSQKEKLKLVKVNGENSKLPEDEQWLFDYRQNLINNVKGNDEKARLKEYLYFRHIPDALYDDMLEERVRFVEDSYNEIIKEFGKTNGSFENFVEIVRKWSYDTEYDDEVIGKKLEEYKKENDNA